MKATPHNRNSPDFEYWRSFTVLQVWQLAALMQGYDALALQTDVQIGGTEQLFNLMAGRN